MLDSDLTTGDGRWLTYAEAGRLLGISADAARQMARRRRWPRRTPNEPGAFAQVLMPVDPLPVRHRPASTGSLSGINHHQPADRNQLVDQEFDQLDDRRTLADAVAALREQLGILNRRLDEERSRADQAVQRADQAERRLADKDATITGLVAEQQAMRQQVETLTDLLKARRSWWHRVFGR
jgi:hypothetical protein